MPHASDRYWRAEIPIRMTITQLPRTGWRSPCLHLASMASGGQNAILILFGIDASGHNKLVRATLSPAQYRA
jgi:hypothetical protein